MKEQRKTQYSTAVRRFLAASLTLCMILGFTIHASALEFPHRADFPGVSTISSEALVKGQTTGDIIIVDVRSQIEYNVIHPVGALHIPISNVRFVKTVQELAAKNPHKKLAFYCNGVTCLKSYKATQKLMDAGLSNVYAYDSGIPEWASAFPELTLLLGEKLVDPENQLIPKAEFKKKCLSYDDFMELLKTSNGLAVDVRDHIQRSEKLSGIEKAKTIPMDKFIPNFVEKRTNQDKTLFIFDQVGKQVRWLEYYLVENEYRDYYFLAGGATSVLKEQIYK